MINPENKPDGLSQQLFSDSGKRYVHFPELFDGFGSHEYPFVAVCSILGGAVLPWEQVYGFVVVVVSVLLLLPIIFQISVVITNLLIVCCWGLGANHRITGRRLRAIVNKQPQGYVLHLRRPGGFGRGWPPPMMGVLTDETGEKQWVIFPLTQPILDFCERTGVKINHV